MTVSRRRVLFWFALAAAQGIRLSCRFKVGLLSEMPPTDHMDETRAVTCLLGLNINAGQEIKLRLRTNDLLGFRNYQRIRETLVHELTHNVWQDHGAGFKTLNSQLLRECVRINGTLRSAQYVLGSEVRASADPLCGVCFNEGGVSGARRSAGLSAKCTAGAGAV